MHVIFTFITCHISAVLVSPSLALYVDYSYPYEMGPLNVSTLTYSPTLMPLNPIPMRTKSIFYHRVTCDVILYVLFLSVFAPIEADEYATFYFVTGFRGIIPAFFYDDFLLFVASHG